MAKVWKLYTRCFWDTPQHFLITYFCLESGFLLFLELQKSLLVSLQGYWTQWQRFESSSIHHFWDTCQHFLKTKVWKNSPFLRYPTAFSQNTFLLRKWLPFMHRAPEIVSFQGCWTQWQRFESSSIHHFWDTCIFSKHIFGKWPSIPSIRKRWLGHYWQMSYFGSWTPWYQSRDDLHTTTQTLEDEPTLAEHNGKGLKALALTISEIPHSIFSKHIFAYKVVFFVPRAPRNLY